MGNTSAQASVSSVSENPSRTSEMSCGIYRPAGRPQAGKHKDHLRFAGLQAEVVGECSLSSLGCQFAWTWTSAVETRFKQGLPHHKPPSADKLEVACLLSQSENQDPRCRC